MKTITTQVFTLNELSAKAKAKARDWYRQGLTEAGLWDSDATEEDADQCLTLAGFTVKHWHWSGFSSQGDGACFTGSWSAADVQPGKLKEHAPQDETLHRIAAECERIAALFPHASLTVEHRGYYSHEHCTDFTVSIADENGDEIATPEAIAAEAALIEVSRDAMRWFYRQLEKDWDWHNADEQVDESIDANGYTFTAEGERFG